MERDEHGWTQEMHDRREGSYRYDLGEELELLDDHEHVRIGDRFGSVICIHDEDDVRGHRFHFNDHGPWLPPEQRPPVERPPWSDEDIAVYGPQPVDEPVSHEEYRMYLDEQEDRKRTRAVKIMRIAQQAAHFERFPLLMEMRHWVADHDPDPVLEVRCSSLRRGRPCRGLMATLWDTEYGLYGRTLVAPTREAVHVLKVYGEPDYAQFAGEETPHEFAPERLHRDGYDDWILIACPHCANAFVDAATLVAHARSTRRTLNIDTQSAKFID